MSNSPFMCLFVLAIKNVLTGSVPSYPTHQFMTPPLFRHTYAKNKAEFSRTPDGCEGHRWTSCSNIIPDFHLNSYEK